jgi:hypothetical protein
MLAVEGLAEGELASNILVKVWHEEAAVVDADFLRDEFVQQGVHPQERRAVLFRFDRQVVNFIRIDFEIEELNVVVLENLL